VIAPPTRDRGPVSAEFAVAVPAIVVIILLAIGALGAGSVKVRLQDAAADAARLAARGDGSRASGVVSVAVSGARTAIGSQGDLVCVTASTEVRIAVFTVPVWAESCALDGGL
jgi:Flp pilus assembly protein TadG